MLVRECAQLRVVNEEVSMSVEMALPIEFSDAAATKVKALITEEENPALKLRVYVTGGGCSGFQYGFTFDEKVNDGDMTIDKDDVTLVVDPMSLQYLVGGVVDYVAGPAEYLLYCFRYFAACLPRTIGGRYNAIIKKCTCPCTCLFPVCCLVVGGWLLNSFC